MGSCFLFLFLFLLRFMALRCFLMSDTASTKVALVTGGSRGIGKATVLELAAAGFNVAFSYHSRQDAALAVVAEVEALGQKALAVASNVSVAAEAKSLVAQTVETFGRLDALVNNAGITKDTLLIRMSDEQWQHVIDTNLSGVFYTTRAAATLMMKQRSGAIVNISSVSGVYGNFGQANYAAAKSGLVGFTKSIAKELGSRGITANVIAPGFIETDMTHDLPHKDRLLELIPLKRFGQGKDIAQAVRFLVTSASYVTGQVLEVSGGLAF
jgi:3-oxoacyl-[acyl-carrier protein] reductase